MQDLIDSRVLNMIKQKISYTCVILKHSVLKYLYFLRSLEMEMDDRYSIHFANVKNRLTVSSVLLFLFVEPPISLLIIFSPSSTLSCFSSLLDLHFLQRMWVWCDETWCFDTTGNPSRGTRFVLASVQRRTVHLSKVTLKLRMDCVSQRKFSAAKSLWKWVGVCVCVCMGGRAAHPHLCGNKHWTHYSPPCVCPMKAWHWQSQTMFQIWSFFYVFYIEKSNDYCIIC